MVEEPRKRLATGRSSIAPNARSKSISGQVGE